MGRSERRFGGWRGEDDGVAGGDAHQLLAVAAREMRTPVDAMLDAARALQGLHPEGEPAKAELLGALLQSGRHLRRLVNDLLTSAYLEEGTLPVQPERLRLLPILARAVDEVGAPVGQVRLACDVGVHALADADRLEHVIVNLVATTIDRGLPPVIVSARELDMIEGVVVTVADQGPGLAPGDGPLEPERSDAPAPGAAVSTELALSIARGLARAMGGEVTYRQAYQRSRFVLTLPAG